MKEPPISTLFGYGSKMTALGVVSDRSFDYFCWMMLFDGVQVLVGNVRYAIIYINTILGFNRLKIFYRWR